jgi:hypothetical protein
MGDFVMPRTPAPLTVERVRTIDGKPLWSVQSLATGGGATFAEEADARAFVALPALIELGRKIDGLLGFEYSDKEYEIIYAFRAALAQADGPAPTEEK